MTKKGADLFTTAIKNGNGARWSYDVAKKVDMKTKQTLVQGQVKQAARRKLSKMIASGELKSQYPGGIPIGKSITVTL